MLSLWLLLAAFLGSGHSLETPPCRQLRLLSAIAGRIPAMDQDFDPPEIPTKCVTEKRDEFDVGRWEPLHPVDTFGSFVESNVDNPQVTCDTQAYTECTLSEQCLCRGWRKLICVRGRCVDTGDNYGIWHDGPVPRARLRMIPRKSSRTTPIY